MRFKTFRALVIGGALALGATGIYYATRARDEVRPVVTPDRPPVAPTTAVEMPPEPPPEAPSSNLRELDREVLGLLRAGVTEDKIKDAFPKRTWKVNVYKDPGKSEANRLKIDLDRDEKWDEKWDFERAGGELTVKRHVAPADDEKYREEYRLRGDRWEGKDGTPTPARVEAPTGAEALREMDREILAAAVKPLGSDKAKDAIRGKSWKVNFYQDAGKSRPNRLKVDLDRDDKWDEKWDLDGSGGAVRQVAPADDEKYTETYDLVGSGWKKR
jgi:hypothetical protein